MSVVLSPSPLLRKIVSCDVATAELRGFQGRISLPDGDNRHLERASPKRRDEYAAGRLCAVAALRSLGSRSLQVGREAAGAPIWPAGMVGSISHSGDLAASVVARSENVQAIGLDLERVGAVEPPLWPLLFSEAEMARLEAAEGPRRDTLATALFAAKEAFYKAQWPITRQWVDFLDIEIQITDHAFCVRHRSPKAWTRHFGETLAGFVATSGDVVAAAILVPAP